MKISELITELTKLQDEYGDIECRERVEYQSHGASTDLYERVCPPRIMQPRGLEMSYFDGKLEKPIENLENDIK
jgi:uncharacterized ferritin-like protein (DUF455 family)